MTEFSKPLLTEETPEPPFVEQKPLEHENERLRQTLANIQGATAQIEEAGLAPKPVAAAKPQLEDTTKSGKAGPKPKPLPKVKAEFMPGPRPEKPAVKKIPEPAKKKVEKPKEENLKPEPDKEILQRQFAITEAVGAMAGNPDPDVFHFMFKLFASAPDKEIPAAAMIVSTAYLRTSAKQRLPMLKALQPALRAFRGSKLAMLISSRLGAALIAKPPAPPPPTPPGG